MNVNKNFKNMALLALCLAIGAMFPAMQPAAVSASKLNAPGTVTAWGELQSWTPYPVALLPGVLAFDIASGWHGDLAATNDGLYMWHGLGRGDTDQTMPAKIQLPPTVFELKALAVGSGHSLVLTNDGLYAWGGNDKGQLGDGTTFSRFSTPAKVIFPPAVTAITSIAAGYLHNLAITNDGLYAWGDNWNGEIGDGTRINRTLPVKVALPFTVTTVTAIAAGHNDSFAVTNDLVYAWGNDYTGQLGNGSFGIMADGSSDMGRTLPVRVLFNSGKKTKTSGVVTSVSQIATGENYALAITNDGLYAWGENLAGCLGIGTFDNTALPVKVTFPNAVTTVKQVAAGRIHSLAVTNDGLYAWGTNSAGQLGIGSNKTSNRPAPTKVPGEDNAVKAAAQEYHSLALH